MVAVITTANMSTPPNSPSIYMQSLNKKFSVETQLNKITQESENLRYANSIMAFIYTSRQSCQRNI